MVGVGLAVVGVDLSLLLSLVLVVLLVAVRNVVELVLFELVEVVLLVSVVAALPPRVAQFVVVARDLHLTESFV